MGGSKYRCKHCGRVVKRDSTKAWVRSYCLKTNRTVHLTRVKRMKIIFLDFDGVLNSTEDWNREVRKSKAGYLGIYPHRVEKLNTIIEQTGAKVVISSTWRLSGLEFCKRHLEECGFVGEVIGRTPSLNAPRREEIIEWLFDASALESYVILDDDGDASIMDHFVQTTFHDGLTDKHVVAAVEILGRSGQGGNV